MKDLCRRVNLGEDQKEKLRLALMTKVWKSAKSSSKCITQNENQGLDAVTVDVSSGSVRVGGGGGGGGRGRGRPRGAARGSAGAKINRYKSSFNLLIG